MKEKFSAFMAKISHFFAVRKAERARKRRLKNIGKKPLHPALRALKIFLKVVKITFIVFLILGFIAAAALGGIAIGAVSGIVEDDEHLQVIRDIQESVSLNQTSFIYAYDENGDEVQLDVLYDEENRVWTEYEKIPQNLIYAFVDIEDERFFTHNGFDIKRTTGAAIEYVKKKITKTSGTSYGGSTITQQLIKNLTGEDDYSIDRKIQEIYRAYLLEQEMSKEDILELYLNTIYLSQQCNGVQSASKVYFNKDVSDLTLEECATIAAITQFPTKYDPKLHPENNKTRRDTILNKMYEQGHITKAECDEAKKKPVVTVKREETNAYSSTMSYYSDAVFEQVLNDLMTTYGYTKDIAEIKLYCGGLKIYSAMDTRIQGIMSEYYANNDNFQIPSSGDASVQSSMVVIDPDTGYVMGVIGGRGVKDGSRTLNRATQTFRQPGSSIKPLSIYSPAVEYDLLDASTLVSDKPITINDWSPRNDDRDFKGDITVAAALAGSRNVPAIRILQHLGVERSYNFVKKNYHISTLIDSQTSNGKVFTDKDFSPIGLGGLTKGVSVLEMAAAYVPFASGGYYYEPAFYSKVIDSTGDVILERLPQGQAAISESTAVTMTSMLQGVVTSGTGTKARLANGMPAAGKTGTTTNNYDRWFVGYTPYYVGAVWYGYDQSKPLNGLSKGNPSALAWKGVMDLIHEGLEVKSFNSLPSSSNYLLCADSGFLPNSSCTKFTFGYYTKGQAPRSRCNLHGEIDFGEGDLVVPDELETDEFGNFIDENGNIVDEDGNPIELPSEIPEDIPTDNPTETSGIEAPDQGAPDQGAPDTEVPDTEISPDNTNPGTNQDSTPPTVDIDPGTTSDTGL